MKKTKAELENDISVSVADFLNEQMGEHARSVTAFLSGNTITVRATNCLSPGEKMLVRDEESWRLFREFKNQQFEKVKPQLQARLEKVTTSKILDIVSVLGQNGVRFELFTPNHPFEDPSE